MEIVVGTAELIIPIGNTENIPDVRVTDITQVVTPSTVHLAIDLGVEFQPEIAVSSQTVAIPGSNGLTLLRGQPSVSLGGGQVVTPGMRTLTLTELQPVVSLGGGQVVTPSTRTLTLTELVPVLSRSGNQTIAPQTLALFLTESFPSISAGGSLVASPGTRALTITELAPVLVATGSQTFTPKTLALTITELAPVIARGGGQTVTTSTLALTLIELQPVISMAGNQTITPSTLALTLTELATVVTFNGGQTFAPSTAALTLTELSPVVDTGGGIVVTPGTLDLIIPIGNTENIPDVRVSGSQTFTPSTLALVLTELVPALTFAGSQVISPSTLALTLTELAPVVSAGGNQTVTPSTRELTLNELQSTVTIGGQLVTPQTLALTITEFAPVVSFSGSMTVTPSTRALTLTEYAPFSFNSLLPSGSMKKNNPGCCTCGGPPSCTCTPHECWEPYETDTDADLPHPLRCKCLFPDGCPDDLPDLTIDIAGSGTPLNDDIPCGTVACDWDGTFVVACNNGGFDYDQYMKYTYICDGVLGGVVKFYYRHAIYITYKSAGVFIKTTGNRASFSLAIDMRSHVVAFPFATTPTSSWLSESPDGTVVSTQSRAVHAYTADSFLNFQRFETDETNCPTEPCNPYGELVECGTLLTGSVTVDTTGQGCYPDPDDVTVTPSW